MPDIASIEFARLGDSEESLLKRFGQPAQREFIGELLRLTFDTTPFAQFCYFRNGRCVVVQAYLRVLGYLGQVRALSIATAISGAEKFDQVDATTWRSGIIHVGLTNESGAPSSVLVGRADELWRHANRATSLLGKIGEKLKRMF